jgi:hypothetical protein
MRHSLGAAAASKSVDRAANPFVEAAGVGRVLDADSEATQYVAPLCAHQTADGIVDLVAQVKRQPRLIERVSEHIPHFCIACHGRTAFRVADLDTF